MRLRMTKGRWSHIIKIFYSFKSLLKVHKRVGFAQDRVIFCHYHVSEGATPTVALPGPARVPGLFPWPAHTRHRHGG